MSEIRDKLYQQLHGFRPIKRETKKQGQSDWYYFDPRDTTTGAHTKEIDVSDEDTPNPLLGEILLEELYKNPQDYYIWRTKQDDKVRKKHTEREGKIFNIYISPEDGAPGEKYNCRCWMDPYQPQEMDAVSVLDHVDLLGLPQYPPKERAVAECAPTERPSKKFVSEDFYEFLGFKESSLNYKQVLKDKTTIGAIGKYQFRSPSLQDLKYVNKNNKWLGKDGVRSTAYFLNHPEIQEKAVREFVDINYRAIKSHNGLPFAGKTIAGLRGTFRITIAGMLAAAHKEGGKKVCDYMKSLEKNQNGLYYFPYEKSGKDKRAFLAIETRLREFAKVDHNEL